ncbi:MAG: glycoside hydrolase family 16 protein [Candidatus Zipacnadales bacterium]
MLICIPIISSTLGFSCVRAQEVSPLDYLPALPEGKVWDLVWNDEFDGRELDESKWEIPPDAPRRDGWWMQQAIRLDGKGHLVISTLKDGDRWVDGCVRTRGKFEHTFGYYVARIKLQTQPGHWSAFWLYNHSVGKVGDEGRDGTEIDIYEKPWLDDRVQHALHWDGYGEHHKSTGKVVSVPGIMEGWHTFALWWSPEEYIFYVDGQETWRTTAGGVCQVPLYIKLSDEIGTWAGKIAQAKLPDAFLVDYVRVYDSKEAD